MSFTGEIEAQCPNGCEPFTTQVWSFIHGDKSPDLREAILARECNLLLCAACNVPFFPPAPYIYFEPQAELLAFVFPESYREKQDHWRKKMGDDFAAMKGVLGRVSLDLEPEIFFGLEELALLLEGEDYRGEEREVMEHLASELGLSLYQVSPRFARQNNVPRSLPTLSPKTGPATREDVISGLEKLVAANDRLTAYLDYLTALKSSTAGGLPPPSKVKNS